MDMSFAQALNEAKQVIVQQSNRIKADAEKVKQQQQTIVDQCSIITDHEMKLKERAGEVLLQQEEIEALEAKVAQATVAREQAEAVCDRQGQRLTTLTGQVEAMTLKLAELNEEVQKLTAERNQYRDQLPSKADEDALAAMAALLTTKKTSSNGSMRIAEEQRAEAA